MTFVPIFIRVTMLPKNLHQLDLLGKPTPHRRLLLQRLTVSHAVNGVLSEMEPAPLPVL